MNADGTNVSRLTFNASTGGYNGEHNATISPDASMVAFVTNLNTAPGGSQPPQIYLVNADGSNLRQLTPFTGGPDPRPDPSQGYVDGLAWSPDSMSMAFRAVVYTSVCGTFFGDPIYVRVIGMIGADGSNPQVIACDNNDGYVNAIDWSPDGTLLAYTRNVQHGAQGCSGCVGEPAIAFIDLSGQNRYSAGTLRHNSAAAPTATPARAVLIAFTSRPTARRLLTTISSRWTGIHAPARRSASSASST